MKRLATILAAVAAAALLAAAGAAAAPRLINYQGLLSDSEGALLSGEHTLYFSVFADSIPGSPALWSEGHSGVEADNGVVNVVLGSLVPIPEDLFDADERWLCIIVDDDLLTPRLRFTSVPWALRAAVADSVSGGTAACDGHSLDAADGSPANALYVDNAGDVGIGTTSPARALHLYNGNTQDGIRVAFGSNYSNLYGEFLHMGSGGLVINSNAGGSWADISFQTEGVTRMHLMHNGRLGIGTTSPENLLHVAGTAKVEVLEITGADMAERFAVSDLLDPGTVVAIDPDRPGVLRRSERAYDRAVAGVISGAGGLPTGAVLGNLTGREDGQPVALSGRVWVKCDAGPAPIGPGDLLTTAAAPGHAMKAVDHDRAQGAVLGKAMTALPRGKGLVLTLISLQ